MKRAIILVACAAALAGCATPGVVASSERNVIVRASRPMLPPISSAEAFKLADAECRKHGRYAQMSGRPHERSGDYVFNCVQ